MPTRPQANPDFDIIAYCHKLAKSGTEHGHQRALFAYLNHLTNCGDQEAQYCYAVPNGGKRDPITAAKLKAEGVKPGVPDTCFPKPVGKYAGLYMEMKKPDGKTSEEQNEYIAFLQLNHYAVAVCFNWLAAVRCFLDYRKGVEILHEYR